MMIEPHRSSYGRWMASGTDQSRGWPLSCDQMNAASFSLRCKMLQRDIVEAATNCGFHDSQKPRRWYRVVT